MTAIAGRIRALADELPAGEGRLFAGVVCNACGEKLAGSADTLEGLQGLMEVITRGWTITDAPQDEDRCPSCSGKEVA